jgi:hypothetical protein
MIAIKAGTETRPTRLILKSLGTLAYYTQRNNYCSIILIFFVGAGFIPARNTGCLEEPVGIKPTPTDGDDVERYMHQLMRYV